MNDDIAKAFTFHYQNSLFKENKACNDFSKANFKRQSLHQLIHAAQTFTSNESTCQILKTKLQDYSTLVDNQNGINNYANGVLEMVPHNLNDTKKWMSKANGKDLLKSYLKPLPGDCYNRKNEGCLVHRPSKAELDTLVRNKKTFTNTSIGTEVTKKPAKPSSVITHFEDANIGKPSLNKTTAPSVMNTIGSRVFSSGKQQPANPQASTPSFRTAGTELRLQYGKKNGNGAAQSYSKFKSLGGRTRSVNSKFVPPVPSDTQEDVSMEPKEEIEDERLRLTDPKLVELIRSEIMDRGPPVGWDDIAGLKLAKTTIQEIVVLPMLRPDIFTGLRRPPKGILLFGPPGTGKTLIGKCVASQSKSTFFNISASSLTSKWVGEGEKMVRTLFTLARVHQPAVVFIDEIDSLLSQRSDSEHESSRRIKTEFLVQLDGASTGEDDRVLVIGATNRPQELDEAARRRLVKRLYIPLPDHEARCQIIERLMASERNVLTTEQVSDIASLTDGYSGADMKNVCQEACLGPIRSLSFDEMQHIAPDQVRPVNVEDFTAALSRVRSSVSPGDLEAYVTWDNTYGCGGAPKKVF